MTRSLTAAVLAASLAAGPALSFDISAMTEAEREAKVQCAQSAD